MRSANFVAGRRFDRRHRPVEALQAVDRGLQLCPPWLDQVLARPAVQRRPAARRDLKKRALSKGEEARTNLCGPRPGPRTRVAACNKRGVRPIFPAALSRAGDVAERLKAAVC